jgi:hypothetical protein
VRKRGVARSRHWTIFAVLSGFAKPRTRSGADAQIGGRTVPDVDIPNKVSNLFLRLK